MTPLQIQILTKVASAGAPAILKEVLIDSESYYVVDSEGYFILPLEPGTMVTSDGYNLKDANGFTLKTLTDE